MALDIKIIKKKEYAYVVELEGSLDTETHQQLREELDEISNHQTKAVILDMVKLHYISSAGISVVLGTKKMLKQKGANFAMVNLKPQIEKVFETMKILPMVNIFDDMPEADKYIDQIIKDEVEKQAKQA